MQPLYVNPNHSLTASLVQPDATTQQVPVQVRRTADILKELSVERIRLFKIDAEGHDEEVLAGAAEFLAYQPPHVVLFESNHEQRAFLGRPIVTMLVQSGYEIFQVPKGAMLERSMGVRRVPRNEKYPQSRDYAAVYNGSERTDVLKRLRAC